jgi:hypothetical protein
MELWSQTPPPPTLLLLGAMLVIIAFLLFRSKRYFARLQNAPPARFPIDESPARPSYEPRPDSVAQWEVEMHDFAREISGQLDSKMSGLAQLIRESDRAAARLEAAVAASERRGVVLRPDTVPPAPADATATPETAPVPEPSSAPAEPLKPETSPDHRYDEIYMLADYGFDTNEIAQRVTMPAGEIQLILSLRTKR